MNPLSDARREIVLSKNAVKNGHRNPGSKIAMIDLSKLSNEIENKTLKTMMEHLVSIMNRLVANEIDGFQASVETNINKQMLKVYALDLMQRVRPVK